MEEKVENPKILQMMEATTMMEQMVDAKVPDQKRTQKKAEPEHALQSLHFHFQIVEVARQTQKVKIRMKPKALTCSGPWMSRLAVLRELCRF